jgi:hypothetical protein
MREPHSTPETWISSFSFVDSLSVRNPQVSLTKVNEPASPYSALLDQSDLSRLRTAGTIYRSGACRGAQSRLLNYSSRRIVDVY